MTQYGERAECDFTIVSRFPGEERRSPINGIIERDREVAQITEELLQDIPSGYRASVKRKLERILKLYK